METLFLLSQSGLCIFDFFSEKNLCLNIKYIYTVISFCILSLNVFFSRYTNNSVLSVENLKNIRFTSFRDNWQKHLGALFSPKLSHIVFSFLYLSSAFG